ncbi:DUF4400 domain-containing protein [Photobacterium carnosum]|uniref:DUF4400 domain-containing protein n=1 Tax=Photobacterium phosphoreum TaxID=659 RepID=A0A2T3JT97_PHOPO|nr:MULTISPECIES: DUF4400 domain-containing protein [Photobacterium]MCD9553965.1 DUF4400 domain-containing protein [Photobacterium carnosum]PSU21225.1 hypothetical protein CTM96_18155 [Photobacterium phosphoreum]PSU40189.1 hypothetical protein CTM97_16090 [Photobacterium phosphoreum]PSU52393.1 hypothetical protein C9J18_09625 [Photobacterium phosphoreum]
MAQDNKGNSQQGGSQKREKPPRYTGGVGALFRLAFEIVIVSFLLLIIAIGVEYIAVIFDFVDKGTDHSRLVLVKYFEFLSFDKTGHRYMIDPLSVTSYFMDGVSGFLNTNLKELMLTPQVGMRAWLYIPIFVVFTTIIKMSYVVCSLPLFLIVWLCMFADGVVLRKERIYTGVRDSGLKWSISMHLVGIPLVGFMLIYLVAPTDNHPTLWLLPIILLSGVGIRAAVSNFSKFN